MAAETFDTIVIGAGQAGPFLAAKLVAQGSKVAGRVESRDLGGTCVNRGCTPTKTLRKSARVAHLARRAAEFGVEVGPVHVNFEVAMERMQSRVDESRAGLESWLGTLTGLTIVKEHGRLAGRGRRFPGGGGPHRLRVPRLMLNTGTRPFVPPIPGLSDNRPYLDNDEPAATSRPAAQPGHHRRRLHRPRDGADLSSPRQQGGHHRNRASADRARGCGCVRRGRRPVAGEEGIDLHIAAHPSRACLPGEPEVVPACSWQTVASSAAATCWWPPGVCPTPTTWGSARRPDRSMRAGYLADQRSARDRRARHLGAG